MGYSATQRSGDPISIPDGIEFWNGLVQAASSSDHPDRDRFSWTDTWQSYTTPSRGDAECARLMMEHYGFQGVERHGDALILGCWGGDKIGSSWDDIWHVIAVVAEPYEWVMEGEDGCLWQESNPEGERVEKAGTVVFQ